MLGGRTDRTKYDEKSNIHNMTYINPDNIGGGYVVLTSLPHNDPNVQ